MGDRRTEVNHPASGITSFTYDALGNVLTKQTANLAKEGKLITYQGGRIKMRSPPKVLTGNFRPSQLSFFLS